MPPQDPRLEINQRFGGVLLNTLTWFQAAVPEPTMETATGQIGVHFEEVAEMLQELVTDDDKTALMLNEAQRIMSGLATHLKNNRTVLKDSMNLPLVLDAICDQLVTATGVAYQLGLPVIEGLHEVNRSNWSKFEHGRPVFHENGKIKKGVNYSPADLVRILMEHSETTST